MHLLTHIYYWCSDNCPDAVPAGILAFNLGMNEASHHDDEIDQIFECACGFGLFDDPHVQLGFVGDDADLIVRGSGCLTANQICSDWQWELIKQQPGLRYVEHDLEATLDAFIAEQGEN